MRPSRNIRKVHCKNGKRKVAVEESKESKRQPNHLCGVDARDRSFICLIALRKTINKKYY